MIPRVLIIVLTLTAASEASELKTRFDHRLEALRDELIELRRDLHRHPEVSGDEERTAGVVSHRLEALGLDVRRGVGGHGVVALLSGEKPGPIVAFRADMDAVYSDARDPVPFASEVPGVRHICGHDVHTTVGVALAEGLAVLRDELAGSVLFVFQPAEETASGANAMIADGALEDPRPEAIFALHTSPFETGRVATARGVMMPSRDRVAVTITGDGDPAIPASRIEKAIDSLTTVSSPSERQPFDADFILAQTRVHEAGRRVTGLITTATRAASEFARAQAAQAIRQLEGEYPRLQMTLDYEERAIAGVTNDRELAVHAAKSAKAVVGDENLVWLDRVTPAFSEDFGSFQNVVPGVMFFLGVSNAVEGWTGMPHTPGYIADEEAIFVGARVMGEVVLDYLARTSWR